MAGIREGKGSRRSRRRDGEGRDHYLVAVGMGLDVCKPPLQCNSFSFSPKKGSSFYDGVYGPKRVEKRESSSFSIFMVHAFFFFLLFSCRAM